MNFKEFKFLVYIPPPFSPEFKINLLFEMYNFNAFIF